MTEHKFKRVGSWSMGSPDGVRTMYDCYLCTGCGFVMDVSSKIENPDLQEMSREFDGANSCEQHRMRRALG